ncbi:BON domain-containing protein [Rugamonas sp. CCM 8940]|uniref:BON domain-containing protein n=1 Tax=Rugamonas sp. CCM 8940 TaxID=2765359 RepID=UPI0018F57ABD|nr:BON domain-containing protein [Rugamonas sp. CCM 8940]MBJ7310950.1 BON domain-containing protein [Rugamonas sp. CCM 8940]
MTNSKLITRLLAAAALSTAALGAAPAFAVPQAEAAMAGATKASSDSTDAAITAQIKSALGEKIGVSTKEGVVVLSGTVANTEVGTKVIQAASAVPGVKEVKSELTVASK